MGRKKALTYRRRNDGIRKLPFGNHHRDNYLKNHQWMLKLVAKSLNEKQKYLHSFKISPHKILNNYEGENSTFTVEKPGRPHLNQVMAVPLPRNEAPRCQAPAERMHRKNHITSVGFLPPKCTTRI